MLLSFTTDPMALICLLVGSADVNAAGRQSCGVEYHHYHALLWAEEEEEGEKLSSFK